MYFENQDVSIQKLCRFYDVPVDVLSDKDLNVLSDVGYDVDGLTNDDFLNIPYVDAKKYLTDDQLRNADIDDDTDLMNQIMNEILRPHPYYLEFRIDHDKGTIDMENINLVDQSYRAFDLGETDKEDWYRYTNRDFAVFTEVETDDQVKHEYDFMILGIDDITAMPVNNKRLIEWIFNQIAKSLIRKR